MFCPFNREYECDNDCALAREDGCTFMHQSHINLTSLSVPLWGVFTWNGDKDKKIYEVHLVAAISTQTFTGSRRLRNRKTGVPAIADELDPWVSTRYFVPDLLRGGGDGTETWVECEYIQGLYPTSNEAIEIARNLNKEEKHA
jgi:hypothetical protein